MKVISIQKIEDTFAAQLDAIARSENLYELEQIIRNGKRTFLEVGTALWRIKEAHLYKSTHSSWESWCADNWYGSKRHADRQIAAARMAQELGPMGPKLVENERQARELGPIGPKTDPAGGVATTERKPADRVERKSAPSLQTRRTPKWLFDFLDKKFGPFKLDAFAEPHNALCPKFYTPEQNGCAQPWEDVTFGNPEFEDMTKPLEQAVAQAKDGHRSIIIAPVGCSQSWYHELAIQGSIYVPNKRINFDLPDGTPTGRADRDTIVIAFGREHTNPSPNWKRGVFRVRRLELPK